MPPDEEAGPRIGTGLQNDVANVGPIVPGATDLTRYDRVMLALNAQGFGGSRPKCPSCPPSKRRGFTVSPDKTVGVLIHCFRGCSVEEIQAALGLGDLFDEGGQPQLFDGDRFAGVKLKGWLALPPSAARHFGVATCMGKDLAAAFAHDKVRGSARIVAYLLAAGRAQTVRDMCGISPSTWRSQLDAWKRCGMAHRCPPSHSSVLTLFREPLESCPNCGKSVYQIAPRRLPDSTPAGSAFPKLSTKASTKQHVPPLTSRGVGENAQTEANEDLILVAQEAQKIAPIVTRRPVHKCPECSDQAGHEPFCESRTPLTVARIAYVGHGPDGWDPPLRKPPAEWRGYRLGGPLPDVKGRIEEHRRHEVVLGVVS